MQTIAKEPINPREFLDANPGRYLASGCGPRGLLILASGRRYWRACDTQEAAEHWLAFHLFYHPEHSADPGLTAVFGTIVGGTGKRAKKEQSE